MKSFGNSPWATFTCESGCSTLTIFKIAPELRHVFCPICKQQMYEIIEEEEDEKEGVLHEESPHKSGISAEGSVPRETML